METESKNIIDEQVKKLPPEVRDVLASDELHTKIVAIGEKHHLHIDQVGILEDEVVMVMMGFVNPADLAGELVNQISIEAKQAEEIVDDVSQQIFLPIRDAMKKFTEGSGPSVVMPSATQAASVPAPAAPPKPVVTVSTPVPAPAPVVQQPVVKAPEIHAADLMLSQPTVSMPPKLATPAPGSTPAPVPVPAASTPVPAPAPKAEVPKPPPYKADPYREPPE